MKRSEHERWLHMIEKHFQGQLPEAAAAELRTHIRGCPACEKAYEHWARADTAAFGGAAGWSPFATDRGLSRLLGAVPERPWIQRHAPGLALALTAAAVALLVVTGTLPGREAKEDFQARGGAAQPRSAEVTLRVLRVRGIEGAAPEVADLATSDGLAPGDRLRLLGSCLDTQRRVAVEVELSDGSRRTLVEAQVLPAPAEDQALGGVLTVPNDWPAGPLKFLARFAPLTAGSVEERVVETHLRGAP